MPTPSTLPAILSRMRDVDATLRKIVYHHILAELPSPLVLTISQREQICQNGLGDRDPTVRAAAGKVIGGWVESVGGLESVRTSPIGMYASLSCQILAFQFLKMLDVTTSKVAEDVLFSVFVTRPDIFEAVEFPSSFWSELSPERAFLARGFVDHCKSIKVRLFVGASLGFVIEISKDDTSLENALPVVTALAFQIQHEYNALTILMGPDAGIDDEEELELARGDGEFVVAELLKLAVNLDYADETGRRKMFALVRKLPSISDVTSCMSSSNR